MELLNCYLPIFKLISHLELKSEQTDDYESFRLQCVSCLEQAARDAENYDVSEFERELALFAVVIWLDEIVLCSTQSFAQVWRTDLLQRKYFQTSLGGEQFFERLNELEEKHFQVRRVFLFCLQSGFRGKYNTGPELSEIIDAQRQNCLPGEWNTWPNDASLTPVNIKKRSFSTSTKSYLGLAVLCVGVVYAALITSLLFYFS